MRRVGIGLATIVIIAGILLLGYYFKEEGEKRAQDSKRHAMMENELNPLSVRKRELERQMREMEENKEAKVQAKGTTVLMFTDMAPQIYKKAYPIMQGYDFKGVLVISEKNYPGAEDCMSKEQFDEMVEDGWTYCVQWSDSESVSEWHKKQEELLSFLELEATNAVYFPRDTYKKDYKDALKKAGYTTIAHCGDEGLALIQTEVSGEMWFPGTYGMNGVGPRNYLNKAMEEGGAIVYRISFSVEEEKFEKETFESMLRWMDTYEKNKELEVMNFVDSQEYHKNLTARRNKTEASMSDEETALRTEMKAIEDAIDAVYKKYLNAQSEEGWNEN